MISRPFAAVLAAALLASCSGAVYDTSDFVRSRTTPAAQPASSGDLAEAPADTATEGVAAATADGDDQPADAETAAAAEDGAAVPDAAAPVDSGGILAFFRAPASARAPAAAAAAVAVEDLPVETAPPVEEFSEAELAGEVEADPDVIAVPEEPIGDGLKHDFVNVYTSRPETIEPMIAGLPGVSWEGGLIAVSRGGGGGDAGSLFGGGDHPFARAVPGIPRQTVQAANGLLLAHSAINVSCVKQDLLNIVRRAESHFGRKVVVTSGYRSPSHNRRVRGAIHSQHLYCNALDLYMPGVARDDLARYLFAQPDRGGIGLYCHTRSIHIDTGKRRQWRWGCRRKG